VLIRAKKLSRRKEKMMKKGLIVLLALLATPAFAALTLTGAQVSGQLQANIGYAGNGQNAMPDATRARAFALIISVDSGATITGCSVAAGNSVTTGTGAVVTGYGVFPKGIVIDGNTGSVSNQGSPVEPTNLNGIGLPSAIGTSQIIIAMGSLYTGTAYPPASANLVTITVSAPCNVTVAPESAVRGGVIAEDATTNLNPAQITFPITVSTDCLMSTAPEYAAWVSFGKPDCWCYQRQCRGDVDGLKVGPYWVQSNDLTKFRLAFNKTDTQLQAITGWNGVCADFDHAKVGPYRVQSNDLTIFRTYFNKAETSVPVCPNTYINAWKN
jgi:hypothetical protein